MAHTIVMLQHGQASNFRGRVGGDLLRVAVSKFIATLGGAGRIGSSGGADQFTIVGNNTPLCGANTCGISASGSGTVGLSISGVALTAAWATSDTISAALVAAVVNASANAKIQYLYGATNLRNSITCVTVVAGDVVNIAGFRFTAVAGTAGAIPGVMGTFVAKGSGTDTQTGTSLAGAINQHPNAGKYLFALNVAGVVYVFPKTTTAAWFTGPKAPKNAVASMAATMTVGATAFAASAYYGVWAKIPGKMGNGIFVAASGTGQAIENSNTYMSRGLGMDAAPVTDCT